MRAPRPWAPLTSGSDLGNNRDIQDDGDVREVPSGGEAIRNFAWARRCLTPEPADRQAYRHRLSARRDIGKPPAVAVMDPAGDRPAARTRRGLSSGHGGDPHSRPDDLDVLDSHGRQVRSSTSSI